MKTFSTYFLFFENKAGHLRRVFQTFLVVGLAINAIAFALINFGVIKLPKSEVVVGSTPAPLPARYLENTRTDPR